MYGKNCHTWSTPSTDTPFPNPNFLQNRRETSSELSHISRTPSMVALVLELSHTCGVGRAGLLTLPVLQMWKLRL